MAMRKPAPVAEARAFVTATRAAQAARWLCFGRRFWFMRNRFSGS